MGECIVVNTGPLVALARIDAIDLIGQLPIHFVCPDEVYVELRVGESHGHIPAIPPWLHSQSVKTPISPVAIATLDAGEAAVIQLALEQNIGWVCIDEWKGRRAALSVGLNVIGTLGLIGKAKKHGLIPEMRPLFLKALDAGVYYDVGLLNQVLCAVNEPLIQLER